ncbi:MAG TPA: YafY family protein [Thermoanaerobaculia bacterium]|nr:YafY family protein [Thermoanaerobaculia bacterium]
MRRADRLFRLLLQLRRGRVTTARQLAERLEVSERTIYRDVADLQASGVPITGEAGVGYQLRGFDLPPLMFDREEIEAIVLGARVVEAWGDEKLARAATELLAKVEAALPRDRCHLVEETRLYVPTYGERRVDRLPLSALREAIQQRRRLFLGYADEQGRESERTVRPLALAFHPPVWLLIGWCELRQDFRNFRVDRFRAHEILSETFPLEPGRTLADYLNAVERELAAQSSP